MKKLILLIAAVTMCHSIGFAQSCLPEGITFTTQAQIDSFAISYPGCTIIEGDVKISGEDISNLNGLNILTAIGGYLKIDGYYQLNPDLSNLTGLDNLTSVGGYLYIGFNSALTNLTGLESLTSIGGYLWIGYNNSLTNLTGLNNLTTIGENLNIYGNNVLNNLMGMESLNTIGGSLIIGGVYWTGNPSLTSLSGLESLDYIGGDINISSNNFLCTCDTEWLCDYLAAPNGTVDISNNAAGCNSVIEAAIPCGEMPCLPYGNYHFHSQSDIANFHLVFPNCMELQGDVTISGNDIMDLSELDILISISNYLRIEDNYNLISLAGLNNLTSVGGSFIVQHNNLLSNLEGLDGLITIGDDFVFCNNISLINLTGLQNLTGIGGNLIIGQMDGWGNFVGNPLLTSLTGLDNLASIGGVLYIIDNHELTSITGIENIEAGSITDLQIYYNESLSTCEVRSVCDYLAAPGGTVSIHSNAPGCNSPEEVQEACEALGIEDYNPPFNIQHSKFNIQTSPNPTWGIFDLRFTIYSLQSVSLKIYDLHGRQVAVLLDEKLPAGEHAVRYDMAVLPAGVYFVELRAKGIERRAEGTGHRVVGKVVKMD